MANVILGLSHDEQVEICDVSLFTSNYLLKLWHKTHTHTHTYAHKRTEILLTLLQLLVPVSRSSLDEGRG